MEYGANELLKEQPHTEMIVKIEVEEAAPSTAYVEIEIDVSHSKLEPGLERLATSEPELLLKKEIFNDGRLAIDEQQGNPGASTIIGRTGVCTDSVERGKLLHIKEEPEDIDLDIDSNMLQHMDSQYKTDQTDLNGIKQENTILNLDPEKDLPKIHTAQVEHSQARDVETSWKDNVTLAQCNFLTSMKEAVQSQIYRCKVCEQNFESELCLSSHTKEVHESDDHSNESYRCDKCQKVCKSKHYLWQHSNRVHGTGSHKCTQCDKEFKCKEYLSKHVRYTHSKEQYECNICKVMCKSRARLSNHVSSFHRYRFADPEDGNYRCEKCMKTFQSKSVLKSHMRYMHGTERYNCTECNREFKCMRYLRTHINYAHSKQQYECDICKKIFKSKRTLVDHISTLRSHKFRVIDPHAQIYTCDVCQKTFSTKPGLREHVLSVHAAGSFQCLKCNRNYKCLRYLQHHEKFIHGNAKFECEVCQRSFNARYKLMTHYERVHNLKYNQIKLDIRPREIQGSYPTTSEMSVVAINSTEQHGVAVMADERADVELELTPVVIKQEPQFY